MYHFTNYTTDLADNYTAGKVVSSGLKLSFSGVPKTGKMLTSQTAKSIK